jgi:hypothetical protein
MISDIIEMEHLPFVKEEKTKEETLSTTVALALCSQLSISKRDWKVLHQAVPTIPGWSQLQNKKKELLGFLDGKLFLLEDQGPGVWTKISAVIGQAILELKDILLEKIQNFKLEDKPTLVVWFDFGGDGFTENRVARKNKQFGRTTIDVTITHIFLKTPDGLKLIWKPEKLDSFVNCKPLAYLETVSEEVITKILKLISEEIKTLDQAIGKQEHWNLKFEPHFVADEAFKRMALHLESAGSMWISIHYELC